MNMTGQSYMNSTTKYVKTGETPSSGPGRYSPPGKQSPKK